MTESNKIEQKLLKKLKLFKEGLFFQAFLQLNNETGPLIKLDFEEGILESSSRYTPVLIFKVKTISTIAINIVPTIQGFNFQKNGTINTQNITNEDLESEDVIEKIIFIFKRLGDLE